MLRVKDLMEFFVKHRISFNINLLVNNAKSKYSEICVSNTLRQIGTNLGFQSKAALNSYEQHKDPRALRAHLILEEVGELCHALADKDPESVIDALADIDYVTKGCALTYGFDLERSALEVHKSNMTKAPRDVKDSRLRDKGVSYRPPNLKQFLPKDYI